MKLKEAVELKIIELQKDYRTVEYAYNEIIMMTSNIEQNDYSYLELQMDAEVEEIKDRFTELDKENYIEAVKIVFNVKLPRKRKYTEKVIYYKIKGDK